MKKGPIIAAIVAILVIGAIVKIQNSQPPEDISSAMVPTNGEPDGVDNGDGAENPAGPTADPLPEGDPVSYAVSMDDSSVEFTGYKIGGEQNCTFFEFDGTLSVIASDPRTATIDMTVDLESIIHDNQTFVNVMLGEAFFDIKNHPNAVFKSSKVEKDGEGWKVTGDLTLRGKTVTIAFPASLEASAEGVSFDAEFKVDRQAWDITYKGKKDALIKDEVVIAVSLVGEAEKSDG